MSPPPKRGREHRVERLTELRALASPGAAQVLDALRALGRGSVNELALHLGRPAESLYYHVRKLERAGLVVEVERRPTGRRPEAVYEPVAPVLRVDSSRRTPAWRRESARVVRGRMRAVERALLAGLDDPETQREGPQRQLGIRHARVRLGRRGLARLNAKLEELAELLEEEQRAGEGEVYHVLTALAPATDARG
jgi:DNA-binding transcriptional ArsR family regulator